MPEHFSQDTAFEFALRLGFPHARVMGAEWR